MTKPSKEEETPRPAGEGESPLERRFRRLGLSEASDFVVHLPIRYEDETRVSAVGGALPGQTVQVEGEVLHSEVQLRPRRQLVAVISDGTGRLGLRWLHFYPNQRRQVETGRRIRVRGEVRSGFNGCEIVHPRVTAAGGALPDALTPVYPTTDGLSQSALRRAIGQALDTADLSESLPESICHSLALPSFKDAIRILHAPPAGMSIHELVERGHPAWRRIKFDELLAQQLSLALARRHRRSQRAQALAAADAELLQRLRASLPFALTSAQERAIAEISADLARGYPMHRLLQGDVGSGKTIVAAFAAAQAIASGWQVAIMAPTEILAEQHFSKLGAWLRPLGARVTWLTGSLTARQRRAALETIAAGEADLVIGTQALIQDKVHFPRLGLVVLDEQHRFGVAQRLELNRKGDSGDTGAGRMPHQLTMSATPIPRTLAMTFFADLDVSVIDELPPGRTPVITKLVSESRREEVLSLVHREVRAGRQAYWVCPLVEESEALQLQTAVDTHAWLSAAFPDMAVGLMHGRMPSSEKQEAMDGFRRGAIHLLVATTVIEVGVDVANANLMIIEHAERFGLAQLHQLRGRVGRGGGQSVCVLMYQGPLGMVARDRLKAMYETTDGFEIARRDLEQRGPGEFLGMRQSGQELLRYADLQSDSDIIEQARAAAAEMMASHPGYVDRHLRRWMRGRQELLRS
ncbi:ATP-dependent DNA helicase RecG [Alcaligenaceae bacterium]|nr:ATP-dependent DNA helicase RecG [Alcaligenaceae bacterium]